MEWIPRSLNDEVDYISRIKIMMIGRSILRFSLGLKVCGILILWTALPMLITLNCHNSIVSFGALVLPL